jgi:hypothetical protein
LADEGFDMKLLSIIGKGYHSEEDVVGYHNAGDRMLNWGRQGGFGGGFWVLLFGAGFFLVPGVGPLLVAGPYVAARMLQDPGLDDMIVDVDRRNVHRCPCVVQSVCGGNRC